jgi:transcriptional repressor NrdR
VHCPTCRAEDTKVVDSRLAEEGAAIRRRRECLSCQHRFTTFERTEAAMPTFVVKADGRREAFDRAKVAIGIAAATKGRRLDGTSVDELAERVEESLRTCGPEISSAQIGLAVLDQLRPVDEVAYLRFASVYKHFDAAADFHREIELLTKSSVDP